MNATSDILSDIPAESHAAAPATISFGQRFYWSVRREVWENGSIYIAPAVVAGLILIGLLIAIAHFGLHKDSIDFAGGGANNHMRDVYDFPAMFLMVTSFVVAFFYCLDALYGERRDRSILFWKSLPVSDFASILAKMTIPVLIIPMVTFAITMVTQALILLLGGAVALGSGLPANALGLQDPLLPASVMLLYHLIIVHGLWFAPLYGWLLLVSAFAPRVPLLWAVLPPAGIVVVEKIAFNTTYFATMLKYRFNSGPGGAGTAAKSLHALSWHDAGIFLVSPGMLIGLVVAAAFLAGAMRLRRSHGPL